MTTLDFTELRRLRAERPEAVREAYGTRTRRPLVRGDGRLFIIAADHPARGALGVGDENDAMADRYRLLERLAIALENPGVDGVLGTPDILDDLALLGLLDDKVLVGSMNRGGLRGSTFEMDDRFTGFDVPAMAAAGIDFAKVLLRLDLEDPATVRTMAETARAVSEAAASELPIMLEPFMSRRVDGRVVNDLSTEAVVLSVAIASGLGGSSAYSWMKLPVVPDMERVMAATTLPTLLLGGDSGDDQDETFSSWEAALGLSGVRGLTVGRTLHYPRDGDVATAVDTAARLVHKDVRNGEGDPHERS
jgi:DhnA family fructose-bisphosphate aldolase class Ia